MSADEVKYLIDSNVEQVAVMLMEEQHLSMLDALGTIYRSQWYEKLTDKATGLYYQSPNYNYLLLQEEMRYGRMGGNVSG